MKSTLPSMDQTLMFSTGREFSNDWLDPNRRVVDISPDWPPPKKEGTKNDTGKPRVALVPMEALREVARVMTFGAGKYGDNNWRDGIAASRYQDALLRHYVSFSLREDTDPESGLPHLAHLAANALMLLETLLQHPELDDRPSLDQLGVVVDATNIKAI